MASIRRSDVPLYLQTGSFFQSLDSNDEGVFDVPSNCLKLNTTVESGENLSCLLSTLRYWGVDDVPVDVFLFVMSVEKVDCIHELVIQFPEFKPHLNKILQIKEAPPETRVEAAAKSQLGVASVKLLVEQGYVVTSQASEAAASVGDLDVLTFLHTHGCPWDANVVSKVVNGGHVECLQYALAHDCPLPERITNRAAATGNISILQCFRENGIPWGQFIMSSAIISKSVECLRYLFNDGCKIGPLDCAFAAIHDSDECMAFLQGNGGSLQLVSFSCGASLPCMKYFHEHGGQWHAATCARAAESGRLDCLQYAHDHGCPWEEETFKNAMVNKHWQCTWYALRNGCPCR